MKKLIISLTALSMMSIPSMNLFAGSGDAAAGVAAGLIGGAMITGIASQSGRRRSRAAETEAREAKRETQEMRREQQKEKIYGIEQKMARQHMTQKAGKTLNMLILAIAMLFLGIIGLAVMVFRKK